MEEKTAPQLTPEFLESLERLEEGKEHLFITGRAGTGKSTLLEYFRDHTKKNVVVLAPTGVAALNVKGQTIHSFFGFKPDITPQGVKRLPKRDDKKLPINKIDAIVIDEVSMVRADLLDCIDLFLRIHGKEAVRPFGGIRMIFIGDLYQLSPVVTSHDREALEKQYNSPYFFDAHVFDHASLECIELKTIHRQKDPEFITLLNAIRENTITSNELAILNKRSDELVKKEASLIHLTTTNDLAQTINTEELDNISSEHFLYTGLREGEFDPRSLPTAEKLFLKLGAQVMLLNNDPIGRWVNGTVGIITEIIKSKPLAKTPYDIVRVKTSTGEVVDVLPNTWELFHFNYNEKTEHVDSSVVGSFTQYPIKLAWAVTIHKSQGKTFERVLIDLGRGAFAHGQVYVALSRCTALEGVFLAKPIARHSIFTDRRVSEFTKRYQEKGYISARIGEVKALL